MVALVPDGHPAQEKEKVTGRRQQTWKQVGPTLPFALPVSVDGSPEALVSSRSFYCLRLASVHAGELSLE